MSTSSIFFFQLVLPSRWALSLPLLDSPSANQTKWPSHWSVYLTVIVLLDYDHCACLWSLQWLPVIPRIRPSKGSAQPCPLLPFCITDLIFSHTMLDSLPSLLQPPCFCTYYSSFKILLLEYSWFILLSEVHSRVPLSQTWNKHHGLELTEACKLLCVTLPSY